jgi:hypothetical protein
VVISVNLIILLVIWNSASCIFLPVWQPQRSGSNYSDGAAQSWHFTGRTDTQTDRQHLALLTKSVSWFKKVVTRNVFVSAPRRSLRRWLASYCDLVSAPKLFVGFSWNSVLAFCTRICQAIRTSMKVLLLAAVLVQWRQWIVTRIYVCIDQFGWNATQEVSTQWFSRQRCNVSDSLPEGVSGILVVMYTCCVPFRWNSV